MRALIAVALVVATALTPVSASADGPQGIRFDVMPVGCAIHTSYGGKDRRVDIYVGRKGNKHVTRTYAEPAKGQPPARLLLTTTFDAKGRMTRKDWAEGKWETFTPYSCFDLPGECRYRYRNGDGADQVYLGQVAKKGQSFVSAGGFEGEAPFNPTTLTFGPFNNIATFREGATSFKVTRYDNCGGVGS